MKKQVAVQGSGIAVGQIVVWFLQAFVLADPIPAEIALLIGQVLGGALGWIGIRLDNVFKREKDWQDEIDDL